MVSTSKAARTTRPAWLLALERIGGRCRLLPARGYASNDIERFLEPFTADLRELSIRDARAHTYHLQLALVIDVPEHDRSRARATGAALRRRHPRSCYRPRAVPRSAIRDPRSRACGR